MIKTVKSRRAPSAHAAHRKTSAAGRRGGLRVASGVRAGGFFRDLYYSIPARLRSF